MLGTSLALFCARRDKEYFEKYKQGTLEDIVAKKGTIEVKKEDILPSMRALELLEKLGYPMDELGTYLYKEVIVDVYNDIKDLGKRDDEEKYKDIIAGLQNALSGTYRYIAKENLEMSTKAFHLYIQKALILVDHEKADKQLLKKIYGSKPDEIDYGLQAFQLAAFLCGKFSYDKTEEYSLPKVKKVANMPGAIRLKYEYKV